MATLIGVTSTSENSSYCWAIVNAGATPVLIPNILSEKGIKDVVKSLSGVLFTGGSDISPRYYDEPDHMFLGGVSNARDSFEMALIRYVWNNTNLPILGVCRGMQLINIANGGTLYQDMGTQHPTHLHKSYSASSFDPCHPVMVDQSSVLGQVLPKFTEVNSFHHQAVKDLAPNLRASAWSPDGIIEAVEAIDNDFRVGVQWHPEELYIKQPEFEAMFRLFVESCDKVLETA